MLDVHPPHHAVNTWRDFFIHIATIVIGLIIAVGLEQTVELVHHRHQAAQARANIQEEIAQNIRRMDYNEKRLAEAKQRLETSLDALNSKASDAEVLTHLQYSWDLVREHDGAWQGAKSDGSLALISPAQLGSANYLYNSSDEMTPTVFEYFKDVDTAAAIVDHARASGVLTNAERQELMARTMSALGFTRFLSGLDDLRLQVAETHTP